MIARVIIICLACISFSLQAQHDMECSRSKSVRLKAHDLLRESGNVALHDYDVKMYGLDLQASDTSVYIEGHVYILAEASTELTTFVVELIDSMQVDSVYIDNVRHSYQHQNDEIAIALNTAIPMGNLFEVKIYYHGAPDEADTEFAGIYNDRSPTWGNRVTWTLSEPFGAKVWWPCKQILEDKADSTYFNITVEDHLRVGSNGLLVNEVKLPDNRVRYEWKSNYPIAYYLLSMTISEYIVYETYAHPKDADSVLIQNYVYSNPATLPRFQEDLDELGPLLELFSDKYSPYPFYKEKYGNCMAPLGGGMEHQTMSTQGVFNLRLDAHELAHQWFGDNVTCKNWSDIWVNEGFARYSEYLALESQRSLEDANTWIKGEYEAVMMTPQGSVFIPEDELTDSRIFDFRLTYQKGGALVHMLRNVIDNDALFFDALSGYQQKFADSVATAEDIKIILEDKSGIDLTNFFDEWYYGEGYPIYNITWNYYNDTLYIEQKQTTSSEKVTLFHTPLEYKLIFDSGDTLIKVTQTSNSQQFKIYMPQEVISVGVDPDSWLLKKINAFKKDTYQPDPITAIVDPKQPDLAIFPNPVGDRLTLDGLGSGVYNYSIIDGTGRTIRFAEDRPSAHGVISVASLKPGLYVLTITTDQSTKVFRFKKE